ncbi:MAG: hypothetical protein FJ148_15380 [Deltaproteobacteria bacterium]|nr:hypothetical protein [Deltaproteobacteria bacterium]
MPKKPARKSISPARRAPGASVRDTMSREAKAAYGEVQAGVKTLECAIEDVRRGLVKAEKQIEAEARQRVRELRKEAQAQLGVLKSRQRDVIRTLASLRTAADESWQDVKHSADSMLADARETATAIIERFRSAIGR